MHQHQVSSQKAEEFHAIIESEITEVKEHFESKSNTYGLARVRLYEAMVVVMSVGLESVSNRQQNLSRALAMLESIKPLFIEQNDKQNLLYLFNLRAIIIVGFAVDKNDENARMLLLSALRDIEEAIAILELEKRDFADKTFTAGSYTIKASILIALASHHKQDSNDRIYKEAGKTLEGNLILYNKIPRMLRKSELYQHQIRITELMFLDCCFKRAFRKFKEDENLAGNEEVREIALKARGSFERLTAHGSDYKNSTFFQAAYGKLVDTLYYCRESIEDSGRIKYLDFLQKSLKDTLEYSDIWSEPGSFINRCTKLCYVLNDLHEESADLSFALKVQEIVSDSFSTLAAQQDRIPVLRAYLEFTSTSGFLFFRKGDAANAIRLIVSGHFLEQAVFDTGLSHLNSEQRSEIKSLKDAYRESYASYKASLEEVERSLADPAVMQRWAVAQHFRDELERRRAAYVQKIQTYRTTEGIVEKDASIQKTLAMRYALAESTAVIISMCELGSCMIAVSLDHQDIRQKGLQILGTEEVTISNWGQEILLNSDSGWLNEYEAFTMNLSNTEGRGDNEGSERFNRAVGTALMRTSEKLMETVERLILDTGAPAGTRVRVFAPSYLSCLPLQAAGQPSQDGSWTCFMDRWRLSFSVPRTGPRHFLGYGLRRLLVVSNPTDDLPEPDWETVAEGFFEVVVLRSGDATLEEVLKLLTQCTVAVFLCHGHWDPLDPDRSGLSLAGGRRLLLTDLQRLELPNAPLIILGCCESGLGSLGSEAGEGRSLPEQFVRSGASTVIATHWPVYVRTATILLKYMFKAMNSDHFDPFEALRRCQIAMRDEGLMPREDRSQADRALYNVTKTREPGQAATDDGEKIPLTNDLTRPMHWASFCIYD